MLNGECASRVEVEEEIRRFFRRRGEHRLGAVGMEPYDPDGIYVTLNQWLEMGEDEVDEGDLWILRFALEMRGWSLEVLATSVFVVSEIEEPAGVEIVF
jgi:hypothetical protein